MSRFDLIPFLVTSLVACAACGESPARSHPADGPASTIPRSAAGTFAVQSELDVPLPPEASAALAPITSAIDDVDDPSRYLLDRMVDELPDGTLKTVARDAVPLVAPYINEQLSQVSPRLVPGLHALTQGLDRITRHLGTVETWQIAASGDATRTVTGMRFAIGATPVEVRFADHGLSDRVATAHVAIDATGRLAIGEHQLQLGYASVVRLGLDHAVIPSVDPGATDLATALADLIDCSRLADLVANELGLATPGVFRAACVAATIAIAEDVYTRLAAIDGASPLVLQLAGSAQGFDADRDGSMDDMHGGAWSGMLVSVGPLGNATFTGAKVQ